MEACKELLLVVEAQPDCLGEDEVAVGVVTLAPCAVQKRVWLPRARKPRGRKTSRESTGGAAFNRWLAASCLLTSRSELLRRRVPVQSACQSQKVCVEATRTHEPQSEAPPERECIDLTRRSRDVSFTLSHTRITRKRMRGTCMWRLERCFCMQRQRRSAACTLLLAVGRAFQSSSRPRMKEKKGSCLGHPC